MQRDIGDILDRASIASLKAERIKAPESIEEWEAFKKEIADLDDKMKQHDVMQWLAHLKSINSAIWKLESQLKSGKEVLPNGLWLDDPANQEALSKIGRTTILIREFNGIRVGFKNIINQITKSGYQDIKQDHLSE
jgi:molecular chaperone DnaK (HSP70)